MCDERIHSENLFVVTGNDKELNECVNKMTEIVGKFGGKHGERPLRLRWVDNRQSEGKKEIQKLHIGMRSALHGSPGGTTSEVNKRVNEAKNKDKKTPKTEMGLEMTTLWGFRK